MLALAKMESISRRKLVYLAWFVLHFFFIAAVSCREITWLVAHRLTILPAVVIGLAQKSDSLASLATAENLSSTNPIRRGLFTYLDLAGIDRGYGYFAPNIPGSYKLIFELHYPDSRVEYALPSVHSKAAGLRVASLLDEIGHAESDAYREYLIRSLARGIWREHADALSIRAIFGISLLPTIAEFERGKRESYEFLYAYDFSRRENSSQPKNP